MPEVRETANFIRIAVRGKDEFKPKSFRTKKLKTSSIVLGKLKSTGKWETQAFLVRKDAPRSKVKYYLDKANDILRKEGRKPLSLSKIKQLI